MDKFIVVFSEHDKDALLSHGYSLIQEPKPKKAAPKKKTAKGKEVAEEVVEDIKEPVLYWVFLNKSAKDLILDSLEFYVYSNQLNF